MDKIKEKAISLLKEIKETSEDTDREGVVKNSKILIKGDLFDEIYNFINNNNL